MFSKFVFLTGWSYRPITTVLEASWNVMAHAQKPDFVFRRNGRVHLYLRWRQFNRLLAAEVCASALVGSNAGYTMFRGSEKSTGYPLHSPVSPSLPLPCVTVCHHISTGLYSISSHPSNTCNDDDDDDDDNNNNNNMENNVRCTMYCGNAQVQFWTWARASVEKSIHSEHRMFRQAAVVEG